MNNRKIIINTQPDLTSCGPTSLLALYQYFEDPIQLKTLIKEIEQFDEGGGTLAVILGLHALKRGYDVSLYSYNINTFDPSWFELPKQEITEKLKKRYNERENTDKEKVALYCYMNFVKSGGNLFFEDLSPEIIKRFLNQQQPILTGLSSTWLYRSKREDPLTTEDDDVKGDPAGHFVVLYDYDPGKNHIFVADPYKPNPISGTNYYEVDMARLINAILLGISSFDGNLLIIKPKA